MLGHSSRELCWENIWSIYTCLKAVLLYFSSMPWPKIRHLFPLRYLKLDLTVKWVIGGILRRYFSCLVYVADMAILMTNFDSFDHDQIS